MGVLVDILYEDQSNFEMDDFYQLARNMNRLLLKHDSKQEQIASLDLSRMSVITKTIMVALLLTQKKGYLFDNPQFAELKNIQPFETRFNLVEEPANCHEWLLYYNIGW